MTTTTLPEWTWDIAEFTAREFTNTGRSIRVELVADYAATLSEDDGTVAVALVKGYGILGETRFSHHGPAQPVLIAAHLDTLADVAATMAA